MIEEVPKEPKPLTEIELWGRDSMVSLDKVTAWIDQHEGLRSIWYYDTRGKVTIGYGTNLDAPGAAAHCAAVGLNYAALRGGARITAAQAAALMEQAAQHAMDVACIVVKGILDMPEAVQLAVCDMIYNLGAAGFAGFHQTIAALERRDWKTAAAQMKDSDWYRETKTRGVDDVALVLSAAKGDT
jgi:GH24 family phage-related lysozyme (muramidase)